MKKHDRFLVIPFSRDNAVYMKYRASIYYTFCIILILACVSKCSLAHGMGSSSAFPTNGLVAYYPFENNGQDESGNGRHGIIQGPASWAVGKKGRAIDLGGLAYVVTPNDLNAYAEVSVSFWFLTRKHPEVIRYQIVSNDGGSYGRVLNLSGPPGGPSVLNRITLFNSETWILDQYSPVIELNTWYHVVAIWTAGYSRVYLNGQLVIDGPGSIAGRNDLTSYFIGKNTIDPQPGVDSIMDGLFDDVRIYDRPLSLNEIRDLAFDNSLDGVWHYRQVGSSMWLFDVFAVPISDGYEFRLHRWNRQIYGNNVCPPGSILDRLHFEPVSGHYKGSHYRVDNAEYYGEVELVRSELDGQTIWTYQGESGVTGQSIRRYCGPVQWKATLGGNDNWYQAVDAQDGLLFGWDEINGAMGILGGHLASITSASEEAFLVNHCFSTNFAGTYAIGGFQSPNSPEPNGSWRWVTDESWNYQHWAPQEPSNGEGTDQHPEDGLALWISALNIAPGWNDVNRGKMINQGYVVEWKNETVPIPSIALSITDGTALEGDNGTTLMRFTIRLQVPSSQTVTVGYRTMDEIAQAGSDYRATNGVVTFLPGQTNQIVTVAILADAYPRRTRLSSCSWKAPRMPPFPMLKVLVSLSMTIHCRSSTSAMPRLWKATRGQILWSLT